MTITWTLTRDESTGWVRQGNLSTWSVWSSWFDVRGDMLLLSLIILICIENYHDLIKVNQTCNTTCALPLPCIFSHNGSSNSFFSHKGCSNIFLVSQDAPIFILVTQDAPTNTWVGAREANILKQALLTLPVALMLYGRSAMVKSFFIRHRLSSFVFTFPHSLSFLYWVSLL